MEKFASEAPEIDRIFNSARGLVQPFHLDEGSTLFHQGDAGDSAYLLKEGLLEVSVLSPDGQKLPLARIKPGGIVGEIALLTDLPRTATISALASSSLDRISRQALLSEIRGNPDLALLLLDIAGHRLAETNARLEDQVFRPVPARLARFLLAMQEDISAPDAPLVANQKDLADHLGVTREAVTKCLGIWKRQGWVRTGRGRLWIEDQASLEEIAQGYSSSGRT